MNYQDQDNLIHYRFARRVGELHPDATYASPIEGPGPRSKAVKAVIAALWVAVIAAIGATLGVLS